MRYRVTFLCLATLLSLGHSPTTRADDAPLDTSTASADAPPPGQQSFVELSAHAGFFTGLRLKAFVYSTKSINLAVEGLYGGSTFGHGGLFPTTFGAGLRSEIQLISETHQAILLCPGLNGYYVPGVSQSEAKRSDLDLSLFGVPANVFALAPNVDFHWLYQFAPHFGVVVGLKGGAAITVWGTNHAGQDLAGKFGVDAGVYLGTRI